jgi:hypothetical protein
MARWRGVGLALVVTVGACAGSRAGGPAKAPNAPGAADSEGAEVMVDASAMHAENPTGGAWLIYGLTKAAEYDKRRPPPANESADDFYLELAAREAMLDVWGEKHEAPDRDLDRLMAIRKAGFLPEFVVLVQGRPGWTIPAATVGTLRLEQFLAKFGGQYSTRRLAAVKPKGGKVFPDVPGGDFPDPERVPVNPATCRSAIDDRRAAWARWESLVPRLGGRPVSASSTQHFGRQLLAVKRDADGRLPDVTWVSERVAHLAFLDGFCAVEAKDWKLALQMLERAVALDPDNPTPKLELSGALAMVGRLEDGLRVTDAVIRTADDACTVGRAWRKRGYILVELEQFQAARAAYEKSLIADPGNPIALKELKLIDKAMKQPGDWRAKPAPGQPQPNQLTVTTCREGKPADK